MGGEAAARDYIIIGATARSAREAAAAKQSLTMAFFRSTIRAAAQAAFCAAATAGAAAQEPGEWAKPALVLELFTSQGCYSCPPAEKLLGEDLSRREGIVAIELHVDYWDDLVYGWHGQWKDPFSSGAHSRRQFAYNRRLRGSGGGYTPQMIVQGLFQASGARRSAIDSAIEKARKIQPAARFRFSGEAAAGLRVEWEKSPQIENDDPRFDRVRELMRDATLVAAIFRREVDTEVESGENHGKTLRNTNVVSELTENRAAGGLRLTPFDSATHSCAVWLQSPTDLRILAAAACPV